MKKTRLLTTAILFASAMSGMILPVQAASGPLTSGATMSELTQQAPIHWVSVEQIAESLKGKKATVVGFDIDDTVLYSSGAFYHGQQVFSPGSMDYLKNQKFWDAVSSGWDDFSVPKKVAAKLIKMHLDRGDKVYFITARPAPKVPEKTTDALQKAFNIPAKQLNKAIFTGTAAGAKTAYMKKLGITIFYGDSDGDIRDARAAGAEGIRVLRALNSTNGPEPRNGAMGEKVIINSQY